ncbi:MAG TPA: DUF4114 domain-containing protein [Steroidobacteraceae bacterium]|nr:DUF4114 domain-containing protein [Steroidobacteraceae bacterium]
MQSSRLVCRTAVATALLAITAPAFSTPINMSSGEQNLQQILNGITVGGHSSINVLTDQVAPDELWAAAAGGGSVSQIIIELAGNRDVNSFGIYDAANPGNQLQLFSGPSGSGSRSIFAFLNDNCIELNMVTTGTCFNANRFGFYLQTDSHGPKWYSEVDLNADRSDHLVAYEGVGDWVDLPSTAPGPWGGDQYVLAFEDLPRSGWDYDYNDFVVMVNSVHEVPEPATITIMGMGLVALGIAVQRRRRAQVLGEK